MYRIYYHNDMDGMASCVVVEEYLKKKHHNPDIVFYEMNYSDECMALYNDIEGEDGVWIVDLSFTEKTYPILQNIIRKMKNAENLSELHWCDHHISSKRLVEAHPDLEEILHYTETEAACICTYKYIQQTKGGFDAPLSRVLELISDYDTFALKDDPVTTYFKLGYDSEPDKQAFLHDALFSSNHYECAWNTIDTGKLIKHYIDADNENYLAQKGYESILPDGTPVYVCNKFSNSWIFGKKYHEYPACIVFSFDGDKFQYSMFSDLKTFPDFDCEKWAVQFGGDGHKGAAGWYSKHIMFQHGEFIP